MDGDRDTAPDRMAEVGRGAIDKSDRLPIEVREILALPSPDWLAHQLTVIGPTEELARFQTAAAGSGIVPWVRDYDALTEHLIHLLIRPDRHGRRSISLGDARLLAAKMRDLLWQDEQNALERHHRGRGCPFDLHRLVPVPLGILRQGDDSPAAIDWLWRHWGTTWPLRQVRDITAHRRADPAQTRIFEFWSADWSPWRAISTISASWPRVTFVLKPCY